MPRRDKRVRAVKIEQWVEQHAAGCAARDRCGFVEWRLPYCLRGSAQLALGIVSRRLLRCSLIILRPHKIPLEFEEHGLRLDITTLPSRTVPRELSNSVKHLALIGLFMGRSTASTHFDMYVGRLNRNWNHSSRVLDRASTFTNLQRPNRQSFQVYCCTRMRPVADLLHPPATHLLPIETEIVIYFASSPFPSSY
ncbi:hypothetical protein BKA80DRAFT_24631 [Phyllosticta citrichinensis]